MKQRMFAFDALKLFAIYLVLWGHSIQYYQSIPFYENIFARFICAFHMPLFMMISGYFSTSSLKLDFFSLIKKKGIQLIIPALVWSVIVFGVDWLYGGEHSFYVHIKEDYWFLKSLFCCYILTWIGVNSKTRTRLWIPTIIIITQFTEIWILPKMYPCFIVGYLLRRYSFFRNKISRGGGILILLILFLLCLIFWDETFWTKTYGIKKMITGVFCGQNTFSWYWVYRRYFPYIIGISGSLLFIGLFNKFLSSNLDSKLGKVCSNWGQQTLGVYLLQLVLLETFLPNYISFEGMNIYLYSLLITPLLSVFMLALCEIIIVYIEKFPFLSYILFGKTSK